MKQEQNVARFPTVDVLLLSIIWSMQRQSAKTRLADYELVHVFIILNFILVVIKYLTVNIMVTYQVVSQSWSTLLGHSGAATRHDPPINMLLYILH